MSDAVVSSDALLIFALCLTNAYPPIAVPAFFFETEGRGKKRPRTEFAGQCLTLLYKLLENENWQISSS